MREMKRSRDMKRMREMKFILVRFLLESSGAEIGVVLRHVLCLGYCISSAPENL